MDINFIRVGILGSTRGTDLQAILDGLQIGRLPGVEISIVISNRKGAFILERAQKYDIPTMVINTKDKTREEVDTNIDGILKQYKVDCVLLIGFMRILSSWFVQRWFGRCFNVHPSLLPAFGDLMDLQVHEAVLKANSTETGCTVHLVGDKVDSGPIVMQKKCSILPSDSPEDLKKRVQILEGEALIETLIRFQKSVKNR